MLFKFLLYVCLSVSIGVLSESQYPEVKIEDGVVRGTYRETWNGRKFLSFTGMPYAEPPTGKLRFKVSYLNM